MTDSPGAVVQRVLVLPQRHSAALSVWQLLEPSASRGILSLVGHRVGGRIMDGSGEYRVKAAEILLQADQASDTTIRKELLAIAIAYARLADHVKPAGDRHARVTCGARVAA